ncbi:MAG: beta-propeller domain-containing protein [Actinomycetota bacterium]
MRRYLQIALVIVVGLAVVLVGHSPRTARVQPKESASPLPSEAPTYKAAAKASAVSLQRFSRCADLEAHLRRAAQKLVGPWGMEEGEGSGLMWRSAPMDFAVLGDSLLSAPAAMSAGAPSGGRDFSVTNVQEAGVDEPDLVKTDGDRIFVIAQGQFHYVDVRSGRPRLAGTMDLPEGDGQELLLAGDRVLVLSTEWAGQKPREPRAFKGWRGLRTAIAVIDVSDPVAMRVVSTLHVEGSYVAARLVDGLVRVVVKTGAPNLPFVSPSSVGGRANDAAWAERAATLRNRAVLQRSSAAQWLPRFALDVTRGKKRQVSTGRIVECEQVYRPQSFSGAGMVTVVTVDPADPKPDKGATVLADASTVYASLENLYVATNRWDQVGGGLRVAREKVSTQIHQFDISGRRARYLASGAVTGHLLNQWALSEHEGHLRVATTLQPSSPRGKSSSAVTVLERRARVLVPVGRIGGLGRDERIYAVRFIGDLGYVVTFRQVDPLYVLDLSNPRRPVARGQLKIPGYSAYLHPIGDGLLLGVGKHADDKGQVLGLQVSVFDVSNPARPRLRQRWNLPDAYSEAEDEHHAFLWWPSTRTLVLPVHTWDGEGFSGVIGLSVDARHGIKEIGRVEHSTESMDPSTYWDPSVRRSLVVGDTLFTMSDVGLAANGLESFDGRAWIPWQPWYPTTETFAGSSRGDLDGARAKARFDSPGQIAGDEEGNVFVADAGNRRIRRIDTAGTVHTLRFREDQGTESEQLQDAPTGLAVGAAGELYVATRCAIWRLQDPAGASSSLVHVAGGPVIGTACGSDADEAADGFGRMARFASARQIAVDEEGSIIVADAGAHAIRRVQLDADGTGTVTTIAGRLGTAGEKNGQPSVALFDTPTSVAVMPGGGILVADTGNRVLRKIVEPDGVTSVARLRGSPVGLAYDAEHAIAFVTSTGEYSVVWRLRGRRLSVLAGSTTRGFSDGKSGPARFADPSSLVITENGDLLVSDTGNHRIRRIVNG